MNLSLVVVGVVAVIALAVGLAMGLAAGRLFGRKEAELDLPGRLEDEREDAIRRSRAVRGGQVAEQLAPYLPEFPADPQDARFLGKPVDFVCFSGSESDPGIVDEILFVEVKSGGAGLTKTEKSVREAIVAGRVRWVEYRIP